MFQDFMQDAVDDLMLDLVPAGPGSNLPCGHVLGDNPLCILCRRIGGNASNADIEAWDDFLISLVEDVEMLNRKMLIYHDKYWQGVSGLLFFILCFPCFLYC